MPPSCARRRAATCFIAISACRIIGTSAGVSRREPRRVRQRRAEALYLEEDGAVYDRVGGHGAAVSVKKSV